MNTYLQPISGFPEFLPEEQIVFDRAKEVIRNAYEQVGAVPIETPAVERLEVLLSKGGDNKEIYGLHRAVADENVKNELGLHFDLTVPLARYVTQHYNSLVFPFKRYAIQPVWRGERAQAGRYRQFYQCDIDVIGKDSLSLLYDAEMPYVIYKIFRTMSIGPFLININNRKIQTGYFESLGLNPQTTLEVIKIIDKYFSFNSTATLKDTEAGLLSVGVSPKTASLILDFFERTDGLNNEEILTFLKGFSAFGRLAETGVQELATVFENMLALGIDPQYIAINLKIARGLDYYTGTVYETKLVSNPNLGSICSGGRYDNLTKFFSKDVPPGVGISIGLTRLIPDLIRTSILKANRKTVANVLITNTLNLQTHEYARLATKLRDAGIKTELFLDEKRLTKQIEYANKKGFRYVLIKDEREFEGNFSTIKNMDTGEQKSIPDDKLLEFFKNNLVL